MASLIAGKDLEAGAAEGGEGRGRVVAERKMMHDAVMMIRVDRVTGTA